MALPALAAAVNITGRQALIARHAHADWPAFAGRDFDRRLTPRGETDARRAAAAMRAAGHVPSLLLVSPARRTLQTARIFVEELALPAASLRLVDALYNASAAMLEAELRQALAQQDGLLLLVAHNPGISQLAQQLASDGARAHFAPADWRLVTLR